MWKELFKIFQDDSLLDEAYKRSYEMIRITYDMFIASKKSLREENVNKMDTGIYEKDLEVNKFQREVRRNVFNHLVVSDTSDIYSSLVLVSVIIDIERLGDYAKNMLDLAMNHPAMLKCAPCEEDLIRIEEAVEDCFQQLPDLLRKSDVENAYKLLQEYDWINPLCKKHGAEIVRNNYKQLDTPDAVSLVLYLRYLRRINSHIRNIATSIVNPFEYIGFSHKIKD